MGRLEACIPGELERAHVPGLSVALVGNANIDWARGFGVKDIETGGAVTTETIFQAASLSKPLFAYAVLKMMERGEIDLDTPLTAYLPEPYVPDDPLLPEITARRVLCHTTGWPNWRPDGQPLVRDRTPGEQFGYSGEGYIYLQTVVEHLTAEPLDTYMLDALLDPLGMTRSSYRWAMNGDPTVATAHNRDGTPRAAYDGGRPEASSSLHTTASDFARFLCAMLTPGTEPWRLHPTSIAEMLRPQIELNDAIAWGLGWGLEETAGGRGFWHWGSNPGYQCFTLALPDARTGIVIMTNGDNGQALCERIVRAALGDEHPAFHWLAMRH